MNPLKKGPEIKFKLPKLKGRGSAPKLKTPEAMSKLKAPAFATDIYADLRDRRLLPLVALLLIAIVAVPILLSESAGDEEETSVPTPATASGGATGQRETIVVANSSSPGLRSYEERLSHRTPSNPFVQKFRDKKGKKGSEEKGATSTGPDETGSEPTEIGGTGTGTGTVTRRTTYFSWAIDVRVVPVSSNGVPSEAEPSVRHGLPELSPLPGRDTPALTFMQPSGDGKKALMLVNSNVRASFGEGVCVSGGETCQLLALEVGQPQTIIYGGNERVFRIEILKIELVESDKFEKAPLGEKPKQNAG